MKVFIHKVWHAFWTEGHTFGHDRSLTELIPQGLGTDDRALIRIMVSRSETDLFNIRKEFKETHDASLHEFIQVETMIVSPSPCLLTMAWCVCSLTIICHLSVVLEFCVFVMSYCLCCCCTSFFCCCGEVVGYSFLRWLMCLYCS